MEIEQFGPVYLKFFFFFFLKKRLLKLSHQSAAYGYGLFSKGLCVGSDARCGSAVVVSFKRWSSREGSIVG